MVQRIPGEADMPIAMNEVAAPYLANQLPSAAAAAPNSSRERTMASPTLDLHVGCKRKQARFDRSPGHAKIPKILGREISRVMRGRSQAAGVVQEGGQSGRVVEPGFERRRKMLQMAHDSGVVHVIGVVEDIAAPFAPSAKQIVAIAKRQSLLSPVFAIRVCHDC
jgi:hypothetical protein